MNSFVFFLLQMSVRGCWEALDLVHFSVLRQHILKRPLHSNYVEDFRECVAVVYTNLLRH